MAEYRRKKQALLKFTKPMQTDQNLVLRDEFEIYLLQEYLRKEVCRLSHLGGNFRMEISLVLVFKSRTFWFRVEDLEVAESNAAL